ncbi:interleukin 12 receptor subunit beta 1 [Turdus rufiventris]|nr:interleukin 12 receptor subunit beta 1 [Turdus rufiventris]
MLGWLLAVLAALAQGGTVAAHDVSCWHNCNTPKLHHCSWPPLGPAGSTSYVLNFCFEKRRECRRFEAGTVTNYSPPYNRVVIFENTTAWVEARWGDRVRRTPNHTLYLDKAVKLDPLPTGMPFSKTGGQLRVQVPQLQCHGLEQLPQHEARFWRVGDSGWTQVTCETVMVTGEDVSVTCALGVNGTFVVQLRHKPPHWSSYWSDWSSNISVPEGEEEERSLPVLKEQRNVTYKLEVHMLACDCAESDEEEDPVLLGWEKTEHNLTLSGAEYEILLSAVNAAGPGPAQQLRVPAEQRGDLSFKEISVAGGTVTARWEAPVPGDAFCFEQQTLPGPPKQGRCIQQEFPANSSHVQRGKGAPQAPRCPPAEGRGSKQSRGSSPEALRAPGCHRLAVHGRDTERGWATLAVWHRYLSNDSLSVPINISSGDVAVVLQWTPSPRAACPGALAKYLICHTAEGDNETCSQGAVWRGNLKYLGILLGVPASAAIYHLTKKRAGRLLFPPLPKPVGTKAVQFSDSEMSQGQPRRRLLEPTERFNAAELLLEPNSSEEPTDTDTQSAVPQPDVPQPGPALEKPEAAVVTPPGCGDELPFAYRKQDMLSPLGSPPSGSTSCSGHRPGEEEEEEEEEEEGRKGLHQPLIPIALLISDKPVIIRHEEGWDPSPQKSVPCPSPGWSSGAGRQEGHGGVPWNAEMLSAQSVGGTGTGRGVSGFQDTKGTALSPPTALPPPLSQAGQCSARNTVPCGAMDVPGKANQANLAN